MDFLDPVKERRSRRRLLAGYCLVALAIGIATLVLLYQSFGYQINRQGQVTQNGIVFISSQPASAAIRFSGQLYKAATNTRAQVPAGSYTLEISKSGYRSWQRPIVVNGGDVQHFDYPFLFPTALHTATRETLTAAPSLATQSPDRRWLLMGRSDTSGSFILYDFKNPAQPTSATVALPDGSFTPGDSTGAQSWSAVEWAADNKHVLLLHTYTTKGATSQEYILLDRENPVDSVNLSASLHLSGDQTLHLYNNRISQLWLYNPDDHTLGRINASDGSVVSSLDNVLAFKPYGDNMVLYVTDKAPSGKTQANMVYTVLLSGQKSLTLGMLPAGATSYALNLAQYAGDWYIAVGSNNSPATYVYKNPQNEPLTSPDDFPAPWRRMPIAGPTYLDFSANTQFLVAENGQDYAVYDFENVLMYHYHVTAPLDEPQQHATWMDGDRLMYVSGGKLVVFDYDYRNLQTLIAANPAYVPVFAPDYSYLYALQAPAADGKVAFAATSLVLK